MSVRPRTAEQYYDDDDDDDEVAHRRLRSFSEPPVLNKDGLCIAACSECTIRISSTPRCKQHKT